MATTREVVEKRVEQRVETTARTEIRHHVETRVYRKDCGCCDFLWIVSTMEGVLKLIQFVTTFLTFVILTAHEQSSQPYFEFLIFVGTTAWIFVILHIILKMTHIYEKLPYVLIQPRVSLALLLVAIISFLVATSVALGYANADGVVIAAVSFGCITMFLFLFELIMIFVRYRREPTQREAPRGEDVKPDEFAY
jgi:hypothetical protein